MKKQKGFWITESNTVAGNMYNVHASYSTRTPSMIVKELYSNEKWDISLCEMDYNEKYIFIFERTTLYPESVLNAEFRLYTNTSNLFFENWCKKNNVPTEIQQKAIYFKKIIRLL